MISLEYTKAYKKLIFFISMFLICTCEIFGNYLILSGYITYDMDPNLGSTVTRPVRFAHVYAVRQDGTSRSCITNANGYYEINCSGFGEVLQINIVAFSDYNGKTISKVVNTSNSLQYHIHSGPWSMGNVIININIDKSQSNNKAFSVYDAIVEAYLQTEQKLPNSNTITQPVCSLSTIIYPDTKTEWFNDWNGIVGSHIRVEPDYAWFWDAIIHEYGHHIQYWDCFADVDSSNTGHIPYENLLLTAKGITLPTPRTPSQAMTLAFSEGWADFFCVAIQYDPNNSDIEFNLSSIAGNQYNLEEILSSQITPYAGQYYEAAVFGTLWDVFDNYNHPNYDNGDDISYSLSEIWEASKLSPGANDIYEFYDYWRQLGKPGGTLRNIMTNHEIDMTTVGIEDYICITKYPSEMHPNTYYICFQDLNAIFVDEEPYGDYIVGGINWKLKAFHETGSVILYDGGCAGLNFNQLPNTYYWIRGTDNSVQAELIAYGTDNTGTYHESSKIVKILGVPLNELPTNITSNLTISGACISNGSTVATGVTLTISPGTTIRFAENTRLTINGNLVANGTILNPITFESIDPESKWGGIRIQGPNCTNLILNYLNVRNSNYAGIYIYKEKPNIKNCNFNNNTSYGIYYSSANSVSGLIPIVENNKITNSYRGIYLYSSNANLFDNEISNCSYGVFLTASNPNFGTNDRNGYNYFHDIPTAIFIRAYSFPFLGRVTCESNGGKNIFNYQIDYYLVSEEYTEIYAENNYWGAINPISNKFQLNEGGWVDYEPHLSTFPIINGPQNLSPEELAFNNDMKNINPTITEEDIMKLYDPNKKWKLKYKMFFAQRMLDLGFNKSVKTISSEVIQQYPDSIQTLLALNLFCTASQITEDYKDIKKILNIINKSKEKKKSYSYADLISLSIEEENYIQRVDNLLLKYKGENIIELILYNKFLHFYFDEANEVLAGSVLKELEILYPESVLTEDAIYLLTSKIKEPSTLQKYLSKEEYFHEVEDTYEIPTEYKLENNYPNPFNPTTVISYQLPVVSDVRLVVYDILGREIVKLVNGVENAGYKKVEWNGSNLASGIYIYRLEAVSIESGKVFSEVRKMIMLK
ncbi:MAG: T9SS type A sorting domain-containing protein [Ignavibacteriales bacterium]|nr:T9SS type A sorting domain-containing protein [Ignavibacteriales bacterium]